MYIYLVKTMVSITIPDPNPTLHGVHSISFLFAIFELRASQELGNPQPTITPGLGNLTPSFGLCRHQAGPCVQTYMLINTNTHKIKINLFIFKKSDEIQLRSN